MFWVWAAILVSIACTAVLQQHYQVQKLDRFYDRCHAQQGVVLDATKRDGGKWVGCYKGVVELPNEE